MTNTTLKTTAIMALTAATLAVSAHTAAALPGAAGFAATAGDHAAQTIEIRYRRSRLSAAARKAQVARLCDRFLLKHQRTGDPSWKKKYFVCRYY